MPSFKFITEAFLMPTVSVFGLLGNSVSIRVLKHKDVKLKKDFIDVLCSLAAFDILFLLATFFLFSMPSWSSGYADFVFPILVPFLYPATNTFMTASIYMTVAVAINRCMDMSVSRQNTCRLDNGLAQAFLVFLAATLFNLPRWFEYEYSYEHAMVNVTEANGSLVPQNISRLSVSTTPMRQDDAYVRHYILIANTVCVLLLPTAIMLFSTVLIVSHMFQPTATIYSTDQERSRKKRNRSITLMLIGIIVLFFLCHIGEVVISVYEIITYEEHFQPWARNLISINHLLIVANSSLNFVIYCKDLVFRQCVKQVYTALCLQRINIFSRTPNNNNSSSPAVPRSQSARPTSMMVLNTNSCPAPRANGIILSSAAVSPIQGPVTPSRPNLAGTGPSETLLLPTSRSEHIVVGDIQKGDLV